METKEVQKENENWQAAELKALAKPVRVSAEGWKKSPGESGGLSLPNLFS